MSRNLALLLVESLFVASCSTFAPAPPPPPTSTATPVPTDTPVPTATSTSTPKPKPTLTATLDVVSVILPVGTPISEWKGIPIMPGAINGGGDEKGYTFTIKTNAESIQAFYETELGKMGFNLFAVGEDTGNDSIMLMFMKGSELVSISIIPSGDLMLVLIVK